MRHLKIVLLIGLLLVPSWAFADGVLTPAGGGVQGYNKLNIVLAAPTTTVIKTGAGMLHLIQINKTTALGVITCYDNTAASGTLIGTITQPAAVLASQITLIYDVNFSIGLTCVTATAAQDITVSYR